MPGGRTDHERKRGKNGSRPRARRLAGAPHPGKGQGDKQLTSKIDRRSEPTREPWRTLCVGASTAERKKEVSKCLLLYVRYDQLSELAFHGA